MPYCCQCHCGLWLHCVEYRNGWFLHQIQDDLGQKLCCCIGGVGRETSLWGHWQLFPVTLWLQAPLLGCQSHMRTSAAVTRFWAIAGGPGIMGLCLHYAWLPMAVGVVTAGWLKSHIHLHCCLLSSLVLGVAGSVAMTGGPQFWAPPLLFPHFASSTCSNPPTFIYTDTWISLSSCSFCWVMEVLLCVGWRRETKWSSHATMMMMMSP